VPCAAPQRNQAVFPNERFHWTNASQFALQLETAVRGICRIVSISERWEIYWAARRGVPWAVRTAISRSKHGFSTLFAASCRIGIAVDDGAGAIAFASSAGAIYAGSSDYFIQRKYAGCPHHGIRT